jgi:hypothetical protein
MEKKLMLIEMLVRKCDISGETYQTPIPGYYIFIRKPTGRVCHTLTISKQSIVNMNPVTLNEVKEWAESVENGYLDY